MKKIIGLVLGLFCILAPSGTFAQKETPVTFSYEKTKGSSGEWELTITAKMESGVKLYAIKQPTTDGVSSSIVFDKEFTQYLSGNLEETSPFKTETDATLGLSVNYFTDSAQWKQKVKVDPSKKIILKGTFNYMYKKGEEYIPGEEKMKFFLEPETTVATTSNSQDGSVENKSLLWIFIAAFGGGLLALLTPCVYSMIPITVSFFTKRSKTRKEGIRNAIFYAFSIVAIFTLLGFAITLVFGPAALNNLATNWIANLLFFVLFVVFGASFLGAFEITLPSSWTNKSDEKADKGGFVGIFFMALTLVLVSFSCTGPIIGNLLVLSAKGNYFGPLVGMFGFSLALALPFALFAFFPSKLNVLGKAGGWLNSVKVTLGLLEFALALKFLSNADLSMGWRLLDREIFISLWIVIFVILGIYLLGKIRFHHDDELPKNDFGLTYLSVTRTLFAIASFSFAVYMIPGLWGAPLKGISAFVPPMGTQDFISSPKGGEGNHSTSTGANVLPHPVKYYEEMKKYEPEVVTTYGMVTYFDYDEALAVARKLHKPLMLDFTGINCVNCRKMEGQVWSDPEVMKRLKEDFIIVSLYVDVQNIDLEEKEQFFSKALNKKVETLGDKNADFQVSKYGANSQPYYFFVDEKENKLVNEGYGYDPDIKKFIALLDGAKEKFNKTAN